MSGKNTDDVLDSDYALATVSVTKIDAPLLPYRPCEPKSYKPRIALIGAGGITRSHLSAYRDAGYNVVAICNRTVTRADERASEFFPSARTTTDLNSILEDPSIDILDIATPAKERVNSIDRALRAGKHVLSQKPFVLDIETGKKLVMLADANNVKLAINQNGRWAPHLSYMREVVRADLIGTVDSVHCSMHWDHSWIMGTPFEDIDDLILSDFGIHWFDFLASIVGKRAKSVFASFARPLDQAAKPPLFAQVVVTLDGGQASLVFDGGIKFGSRDSTFISGSNGSVMSTGPDLGSQTVKLITEQGEASPNLNGTWFNDGFHGAMAELICAIEDDRPPLNDACDNLIGLSICFAAIEAAQIGKPISIQY